ncbi:MAG: iron-containing alcohol dehydrogenase [Myxococcales bacterium]|nr:iron-containing alcohol dehydrogenase [Myxococcales bacterium]
MRTLDHHPTDAVHLGPDAEAFVVRTLVAAGARRILVLAQGHHRAGADRLAGAFGPGATVFAGVTRQVPPDVVASATRAAAGVDWIVAHGGGSAIGVAKAVALTAHLPVAAVPTTYAGSARTGVWGLIDAQGRKHTGRDPAVRPRVVGYDPALLAALPQPLALKSLLNAVAHSVEALYAAEATPQARAAAHESLEPLWAGLHALATDPRETAEALYGAYLAGTALDGAQMALQHKLAHVLAGEFGTAHADTHAVLLPYTLAWNLPAAPQARAALQDAWGVADPAGALLSVLEVLGLPTRLADLGVPESALPAVAARAAEAPYPNPRPLDEAAFATLLAAAWRGTLPESPP